MAKGRVIPGWRPSPPPYASEIGTLLLSTTKLSSNERAFLKDVQHSLHLTEKQTRYLYRLINRATRDKAPQHRRRRRGFADDLDYEIRF
jgi:hypothetical protein